MKVIYNQIKNKLNFNLHNNETHLYIFFSLVKIMLTLKDGVTVSFEVKRLNYDEV